MTNLVLLKALAKLPNERATLMWSEAVALKDEIERLQNALTRANCDECHGSGRLERKEDGAPMDCWACSPQPKRRTVEPAE